jgi:hypothetical protein
VSQAAITFDPETGCYGFKVWMAGKRPHYEMSVFDTAENARNWLDPHCEREWEESKEPGIIVMISRGYKDGTVPTRV